MKILIGARPTLQTLSACCCVVCNQLNEIQLHFFFQVLLENITGNFFFLKQYLR